MQPEKQQECEGLGDAHRVLLFDENFEDLIWHAEPFEAASFEVHKCMSMEAAMRCVEREEFDLALVDQVSSAFEGIRVLKHLVRYNVHTPFVVVARLTDKWCQQQALALGALDYLEKPIPRSVSENFSWSCGICLKWNRSVCHVFEA